MSIVLKKREEHSSLFFIVLIAAAAAVHETWGEDGEENEKRGNELLDFCQVAAAV